MSTCFLSLQPALPLLPLRHCRRTATAALTAVCLLQPQGCKIATSHILPVSSFIHLHQPKDPRLSQCLSGWTRCLSITTVVPHRGTPRQAPTVVMLILGKQWVLQRALPFLAETQCHHLSTAICRTPKGSLVVAQCPAQRLLAFAAVLRAKVPCRANRQAQRTVATVMMTNLNFPHHQPSV